MITVNAPGKKIKDICTVLGESYSIKVVDLENVIYRNLGNGYDFEISGLDNNRKSFNTTLYVWDTSNGSRIVETISGIESIESLKGHLDTAVSNYI